MPSIIIPMAGRGERFAKAGYTFPKPFIEVKGKLMVEYVLENFQDIPDLKYVFVVLKEHVERYNITSVLTRLIPDCKVVVIDDVTDGAARTVLIGGTEAKIEESDGVFVANCDQWIEWNGEEFYMQIGKDYHWITTFDCIHPKFSYVRWNGEKVIEVKEKDPISNIATTGIYYFKSWADYKWAANQMITKNKRTNNEFYLCPVYQELIDRGDTVKIYPVKMHSIGTPEDLDSFNEFLGKTCL